MADSNIHGGHRSRMREKFLAGGAEVFPEHELLEMLLFYALPRRDTNEIAHQLIERFGSLEGVLDALISERCNVDGISQKTSLFLSLIGEISRRYTVAKIGAPSSKRKRYNSNEKLAAYLHPKFIGLHTERAYLLLLDNASHILDCICLGDGDITSLLLSVRTITEHALLKHASAVVLAHNHPNGIAVPSGEDLNLTRHVSSALRLVNVTLLEHFVFSNNDYSTIVNHEFSADYSASIPTMYHK